MNVKELIRQLERAPQEAKILCFDDSVVPNTTIEPQVIWWSDDRETVYLGMM